MPPSLSPTTAARFRRLATDLRKVFEARFVGLTAYGPRQSVVFADSIAPGDLDAMAALVTAWHTDHLATPVLMTPAELSRSLDAFPLEFQAMIDRRVVIDGADVLASARVDAADLRRAVEVQAKSHLVHLRQGWLEAHGDAHELTRLVARSSGSFRTLLEHCAQVSGTPAATDTDLVAFAERSIHFPPDLARDILSLEEHPEGATRAASRLGEYVAGAERLWQFVDDWIAA